LELYHKKTIFIAFGTLIAAVINYILNIVFIPIFGFVGAAYATGLSYLVLALLHLYIYRYITKGRVYDDNFVWIIVFITCLASFIVVEIYDFILIRYLIMFVIMSIFILIFKKNIYILYNYFSGN
jgi:O-antigen/teichoic acid export membrane protein